MHHPPTPNQIHLNNQINNLSTNPLADLPLRHSLSLCLSNSFQNGQNQHILPIFTPPLT